MKYTQIKVGDEVFANLGDGYKLERINVSYVSNDGDEALLGASMESHNCKDLIKCECSAKVYEMLINDLHTCKKELATYKEHVDAHQTLFEETGLITHSASLLGHYSPHGLINIKACAKLKRDIVLTEDGCSGFDIFSLSGGLAFCISLGLLGWKIVELFK